MIMAKRRLVYLLLYIAHKFIIYNCLNDGSVAVPWQRDRPCLMDGQDIDRAVQLSELLEDVCTGRISRKLSRS